MIEFKEIHKIKINALIDFLGKIYQDRIAIVDYTESNHALYTYQDLAKFSIKYHSFLSKFLAFQEDVVYINKNSIEHLFLLFATLRGGYRYVPINPRLKENEIVKMLSQLKTKLLIYGDEFKGNIDKISKELRVTNTFHINDIRREISNIVNHVEPEENLFLEDDWIILFTSGTTGIPKAARLPIRMVLGNILQTIIFWQLKKDDSSVIHTPFFHAGGLNVLTTPLLFLGGKLYLLSHFNPEVVLSLIEQKKINKIFAVPTMYKAMIDHPNWKNTDLSNLDFAISGGAPCPEFIIKEFEKKGVLLRQGFGMTEVGVNCFFINEKDIKRKLGSVGIPMIFLDVKLTDPETNQIIEGEGEGLLWFKGFVVFKGYEGISYEATFDEKLGFCSGDIAYRDKDGFYWIKGRKKDIIIRGGENIYPLEIEKEVQEFEEVDECSLIGIEDDFWGEKPVLGLKFKNEVNINQFEEKIKNIIQELKAKLASYKIPHEVFVIKDFPKTSTGKISKKDLKEIYKNEDFVINIKIKQ